jgi:uncharacterized protein (DUF2147 family)
MKQFLKSPARFLIGIALLFITTISSAQNTGDEIIDTWWNQEREAQIEIYQNGGKYSGKIVWLKDPNDPETGGPKLDKKNPDSKFHSRTILGSDILYGFTFDKNNREWVDGTIYDGREGKTYKCYITLNSDGTLNVRGYVGASWMGLGKTHIWIRKTN